MEKIFTTEEIRNLYDRFFREEISFSEMVEILNEMVSEMMSERMEEMNEPKYKEGDFVVDKRGDILIFKKKVGNLISDHAYLQNGGILWIAPDKITTFRIERYATEEEKQKLLDALAKEGKRWNEEKKCIEDIPVPKFQSGDKVRIKGGVSSETHKSIMPFFLDYMDKLIGKELTVRYCSNGGVVACDGYLFSEDWLEPYEELKKGDLAIFWDFNKKMAFIGEYNYFQGESSSYPHIDNRSNVWKNAIKFESEEQYKKLLKGEI